MKEGLIFENGELIYYKDGYPEHAGAVQIDGDIYYIGSKGRAVRGSYVVHSEMANGILKRGTYTFGEDYKLVKGSYIAPKKRKKKKSGGKSAKKPKRPSLPVLITLGVLLIAVIAVILVDTLTSAPPDPTQPTTQTSVAVTLPTFDGEVLLCSPAAKQLYDGEASLETAIQAGDPYRAFTFEYTIGDQYGILLLSESPELSDPREFIMEPNTRSLTIDNLKTGTTYYYKVTVADQEYPGSFRTAASTRFLSVPGVVNLRDIGGYTTQDGKTVRQGLLIRGVEIDGLVSASYYIPAVDLEDMQNTFGFVCDFDLRSSTVYTGSYISRLGKEVTHKFYNAPRYSQIFNSAYLSSLREIFADLAKPENYPLSLHCTWGTDRTGTIIFLLQGILNMSQEDMEREYGLTGFVTPELKDHTGLQSMIDGLEPYAGGTIQEKIVTYLTTVVGVTEAEIESIRTILLSE